MIQRKEENKMCKTLDLLNELNDVLGKIAQHGESLNKELSLLDGCRNDIMHLIENAEITQSKSYNIMKAFQLLSLERRLVKNEVEIMQSVLAKTTNIQSEIVELTERKEREYEKKVGLVNLGMDSYKPRSLDLDGNVLQQVKDLVENKQW